jgi:hypothetical protein
MTEEDSTPIAEPMELGEMANWTPLDGSEGLKRKRAEDDYDDYVFCEGCGEERKSVGPDSVFTIDNARGDVLDDGNVLCDRCHTRGYKIERDAESFESEEMHPFKLKSQVVYFTPEQIAWIEAKNLQIKQASKNPRKNERIISKYMEELVSYIDSKNAESFAAERECNVCDYTDSQGQPHPFCEKCRNHKGSCCRCVGSSDWEDHQREFPEIEYRAESPSATIPVSEPSWVKPVATALGFGLGFLGIRFMAKEL